MTITNTSLGHLGLTAADLALGLCPEAVAHLARCAAACRLDPSGSAGVPFRVHGSRHCAGGDGAKGRAPEKSGALL